MEDRRGVRRVLVGRPDEKQQLAISRRRWKDNIKMDIRKIGCGDMEGIDLGKDSGM
jgi:hypothetical protein